MNCKEFKIIIDKYIEGDVDKSCLKELNLHADTCSNCRKELLFASNLESVLKQSVPTNIDAQNASERILSDLQTQSKIQITKPAFKFNKWLAAAACILIGFGLAKISTISTKQNTSSPKVPLTAVDITGTVLVKRLDAETWQQLSSDQKVYLGDTFQAAGNSGMTLVFEDGSTMTLRQNTMLQLKEFNGKTDFYLSYGKVHSDLRSPHAPFFISTPHGRAEALGTDFTVTVD